MTRRALLLVAFLLLTSAATAYAECAWVLWAAQWETPPIGPWNPQKAFETRQECEQEREASHKAMYRSMRFVCFPDTVDPRGPKGK